MLQLLLRRRDDEDQDGVGHEPAHLLGALDVDLEDHVAAGVACAFDAVAEGAVEVAVVGRVLDEGAFRHEILEFLAREERVILVRSLPWPGLARRARDRVLEVGVQLEQAADDRVLADTRGAGDDDEHSSLQASDSQKAMKSGGGGASKLISAPVRGWRKRRRQAWSIGRWAPASPPPYSLSP